MTICKSGLCSGRPPDGVLEIRLAENVRVESRAPEHLRWCRLRSVVGTSLGNGEAPLVPEVDAFFAVAPAGDQSRSIPTVMTRSLAARRLSICVMLH